MTEFPIVRTQFFWEIKLNELVDLNSWQVKEFVTGCPTPKVLADKVIRVIEYPFHAGQPDDLHILNTFHGKWCKKISLDFWQPASWTAVIKIGDCEDSSILFVACCRAIGVPPEDVYEVFGYVRDANTGEILGGHGWSYCRHESFGDDEFHYIESTLDTPPREYPVVPDIRKPFRWGNWELVPEIIWNDKYYEEINLGFTFYSSVVAHIFKIRRKKRIYFDNYFDLRFKEKETRNKYEALAQMWGVNTKPLKKTGFLSKIRWRR